MVCLLLFMFILLIHKNQSSATGSGVVFNAFLGFFFSFEWHFFVRDSIEYIMVSDDRENFYITCETETYECPIEQ